MNNAREIKKPMMVQQGGNDPKVPQSESDQIVAALKDIDTPVWYLLFANEGHGFLKKGNVDYPYFTQIMVAKEFLLSE